MKNRKHNFLRLAFLFTFFIKPILIFSCTIVSAIDYVGHVWNANNEDGPFGIANFINVFPKSENTRYGYYTLSYLSPAYGQGGAIQGGMNETGLTFDFNTISKVTDFDPKSKESFPKGDDAILPHILANMSSVEEVISFFETYWFQNGFVSAQMHVADRHGRFAIISASGIELVEKGKPLISTNFDICGKEDGSNCWRYPIAASKLAQSGAGLSTMTEICKETAQKNGATMYSNIQNLTTGDIWFFSKHDPGIMIQTNIKDLIAKGKTSYSFSNLKSIKNGKTSHQRSTPQSIDLEDEMIAKHIGVYQNAFIGKIIVQKSEEGILLTFQDGQKVNMKPSSTDTFFLPEEDIIIKFSLDKKRNQTTLSLFEDGLWSLTAWKTASSENVPE